MYIFPTGCSLSYSSICPANQRHSAGSMHIPIPNMINEQKKHSSNPSISNTSISPCQVLEIHLFSHQLLGWGARRAPQPLSATKGAKLIALTLDLYSMLSKIYLYVYFVFKGSPDRPVLGHRHHVLLFENSLICPTQISSTELKVDENTALQICSYLGKTNWNYFLLNVSFC